jgi:cell division protein FtsQ
LKKGKVISLEDRVPNLKLQRRKKANRRLLSLLIIFFLLFLSIVYFQSPLSHVRKINIVGNSVYTDEQLTALSGITKKTNIWKVNEEKIEKKINKLVEIKSVKVKTQLPSQVTMQIEEWDRIAYIMTKGQMFPVLENGEILKEKSAGTTIDSPVLVDFSSSKMTKEMIIALNKIPEEVLNSISEIHYSPKKTDQYHIELFMNDGFEVSASLRSFSEKMSHYPEIARQLDPKIKGVIDMEVGSFFKAYDLEGTKEESEKNDER